MLLDEQLMIDDGMQRIKEWNYSGQIMITLLIHRKKSIMIDDGMQRIREWNYSGKIMITRLHC